MQKPSPVEDAAFLHAEARELAMLAEESVEGGMPCRKPASILHTLGVELSILMGLGDSHRIDWLMAETSRLLMEDGKQEALCALQDTLRRLRSRPSIPSDA